MRAAVITFPGSNCDHDAWHVIHNVLKTDVDFVWHKDQSLDKYEAVIIPGGFSYGDYLRAGAIARFSPVMEELVRFAKSGKPILGICNGFQILVETGLLPGALLTNRKNKFISRSLKIHVENADTPFTRYYDRGELLELPVAHKQGNYTADEETLKRMKDQGQIVFTYAPADESGNPNGSLMSIAGVINEAGNVLGMMPHPERASESVLGSRDGIRLFKSMLGIS